MPNPVVHFEVQSKDSAKARDFYADLFGWKVSVEQPMNYGMVETNATGGINGGIAQSMDSGSRITFYVQVDDLQATLTKAESLGGKTIMPPMEIPNMMWIAMFTDLDGNPVGLMKNL